MKVIVESCLVCREPLGAILFFTSSLRDFDLRGVEVE